MSYKTYFLKKTQTCFISLLLVWSTQVFSAPQVVVSITPFHGLVAAVMQNVGTPTLLVEPGASPHHYTLKPSQMMLLNSADVVFWAGPTLESFLTKALHTLQPQPPKIIQFDTLKDLHWLPMNGDECDHHDHLHTHRDMHFWLDPTNAIVLTRSIVETLSSVDPINAQQYQENGRLTIERLQTLDTMTMAALKTIQQKPFIVFHNAYQYFTKRYHLDDIGAITINPEIPPSVKQLQKIRRSIQESKAICVFTEPQFQPKIVQSIVKNLSIRVGELNPLGITSSTPEKDYFLMIEALTHDLKMCLQPDVDKTQLSKP